MEQSAKIYVAGHQGMVGRALCRVLDTNGYHNRVVLTSHELDLRNQQAVESFFKKEKPDYVFLAAAKVGGIHANNTYRAEFLYDNLMIACNVIHSAYQVGVQKLLYLGSSCIYPKHAPQPLKEEYLLTSELETTNEPYAIAKIAGLKLCEAYWHQYGCRFIAAMPTNLYGPFDNYDPETSHVLPALIRKFHEAAEKKLPHVTLWGTGTPRREFMHVDDLAQACFFLMKTYEEPGWINVGTGMDITISDLAECLQEISNFQGKVVFDSSKPDGTPRKLLDTSRLKALGFEHKIGLEEGLRKTYEDFARSVKENSVNAS